MFKIFAGNISSIDISGNPKLPAAVIPAVITNNPNLAVVNFPCNGFCREFVFDDIMLLAPGNMIDHLAIETQIGITIQYAQSASKFLPLLENRDSLYRIDL